MKEETIANLYSVSLVLIVIGFVLLILWMKRIYPKVVAKGEIYEQKTGQASKHFIVMQVLMRAIPGIFVVILFCIPSLYLKSLQKRYDHCGELLRANKSVGKTKADFKDDCKCIDLDEVEQKINSAM